jgi:1-deoxyxylulose-5-phosphate synthase
VLKPERSPEQRELDWQALIETALTAPGHMADDHPAMSAASRPGTIDSELHKALHVAEKHGWTRFVSMQNHLNLIYREEEEREVLPLCREEKIGVIPYSPLASGRLTRDWSSESTLRSETDQIARTNYDATADTDRQVVERVAELADKHEVPRVHIALAWLLQKKPVTAPSTKITHLEAAVGALSVTLTEDEVTYLEEPYTPHPIVGHQ